MVSTIKISWLQFKCPMVASLISTKKKKLRRKVTFVKTKSIQDSLNSCVRAIIWSLMRKLVKQAAMKPSRCFKLKQRKITKMKTLKSLSSKSLNLKTNGTSNIVSRKFLIIMVFKMPPVENKRRNLFLEMVLNRGILVGLLRCAGVFMIRSEPCHLKLNLTEITKSMKQVCSMPFKVKLQRLNTAIKIIVCLYRMISLVDHWII